MLFLTIALFLIFFGIILSVINDNYDWSFVAVMIGMVFFLFGNLFGSAFNDSTQVVETQTPVSVKIKVVNGAPAYTWSYEGRDYSVPVDGDGSNADSRTFTKPSVDATVTIEHYVDDKWLSVFGPKSDDTVYRISTGALAK